jgi:hypothetical protein
MDDVHERLHSGGCRRSALNARTPLLRLIALLAATTLGGPLAAQPAHVLTAVLSGHVVTEGGSFDVQLRTSPDPIKLNEYFELIVAVSVERVPDDANPVWVSAEARMPEHQHGMSTRPRRENAGDGRFVFKGMLFHMAGEWEIVLDVAKGRTREKASTRLRLE